MQHATDDCEFGCRDACLHQIEFIPQGEQVMLDGHDVEGFCNFVCQFVSIDCPRADKFIEQSCANIALCGNRAPQWLLDCQGGLCQPCDMMYGRVFEFSSIADDDVCPVCLETGVASVTYK